MSVSELQELFACEICPVVGDDGVGDAELVNDVNKELDSLLGVGFGDRLGLDPFGEFIHRYQEVSKPSRSLFEGTDHVETIDCERPRDGDGLDCLHR